MLGNPFDPPTGLYCREDRSHQDWLLWWLDTLEVPFSRLDDWGDQMEGHGALYMDYLVTKYRAWQRRKGPAEARSIPEPSPITSW